MSKQARARSLVAVSENKISLDGRMTRTFMYKVLLYYRYADFWISLDYVDIAAWHPRMKQHYQWYLSSSFKLLHSGSTICRKKTCTVYSLV